MAAQITRCGTIHRTEWRITLPPDAGGPRVFERKKEAREAAKSWAKILGQPVPLERWHVTELCNHREEVGEE